MSPKDFIDKRVNATFIADAKTQQDQLYYFTKSSIQKDVVSSYIDRLATSEVATDDYFLNYVKMVFRKENFVSFSKYLRYPLPSSHLINSRIINPLRRVFNAEDAFFNYNIKGDKMESVKELNSDEFDELMFNAILFRHNDILVTIVKDVNTPQRDLISIDNVISIKSHRSKIQKIAYSASVEVDGESIDGYMYLDHERYLFVKKEDESILFDIPHDLDECPADYIVPNALNKENDVVRESIFSYVRGSLEEYVFLKTLQLMTEPNGAIPVVVRLSQNNQGNSESDGNLELAGRMTEYSDSIGGQKPNYGNTFPQKDNQLQTGTIVDVPRSIVEDSEGSINADKIKNYLTFHHLPIEPLKYLSDRIDALGHKITVDIVGHFSESTEVAKNEKQVSQGFVSKEDKIRDLSNAMSRIRTLSDYKFLALEYGKENIHNEGFYGQDFFIETQEALSLRMKEAPNAIERNNILLKIVRNKNMYNHEKKDRDLLLLDLLPYKTDVEFKEALSLGIVSQKDKILQTRLHFYINEFESHHGDILEYYRSQQYGSRSENIILIKKLIEKHIKTTDYEEKQDSKEFNSVDEGVQG